MIIGGANFSASLSSESVPFTWTDFNNGTYTVTYNTTIASSSVPLLHIISLSNVARVILALP